MNNKALILTGAAGGVGMNAARTLALKGYTVFAGAIDPWEDGQLRSLVSENPGAPIVPVRLDLRDHSQINAVVQEIESRGLALAGLVLNGAASPHGVPAEHITPELLRDTLETNVIGNFAAVLACLPLLKRDGGRIVFISSATTYAPPPMVLPYVTSKCAINSLAHVFRRELRNTPVRVSLLLPEVIQETYMAHGLHQTTKEHLAVIRSCTPDEVSTVTYPQGGNTALAQPEDKPDPFYEDMLAGQLATIHTGIEKGIRPSVVSDFILRALEDEKPKPVYIVGKLSWVFKILAWVLPVRAMDWVVVKMGYR